MRGLFQWNNGCGCHSYSSCGSYGCGSYGCGNYGSTGGGGEKVVIPTKPRAKQMPPITGGGKGAGDTPPPIKGNGPAGTGSVNIEPPANGDLRINNEPARPVVSPGAAPNLGTVPAIPSIPNVNDKTQPF